MLCDKCTKKNATVHITKIVNGAKQEFNICEDCAKELEGINKSTDVNMNSPFTFQDVLSGIMNYMYQPVVNEKIPELVCENCGMSYSEFKKSGVMGCSQCYEYLNSTILPVIKRVQGNIEHNGKIPNKLSKEIVGKKTLLKLQEELQRCIASEEYEMAAKLRDNIRDIKKDVMLQNE